MLCPNVSDFPAPKVYAFEKQYEDNESVTQVIRMNNFYKSVIITWPDEHKITFFEDLISEDSDYYRLSNCSITAFIDKTFIEYFVKCGKITCLSADRNCIVQSCAAITPDGMLTIHVLESIYQTLGLEGTKRPHGYYEVRVNLKTLKHYIKIRNAVGKLEAFDFYMTWEPDNDKVCPSSVAKYFWDKKVKVSVHKVTFKNITPHITQIPTLLDADLDEMAEWIGMLAHEGDVSPTEEYISSYSEPDCQTPIQSTRISILIAKGFLTPTLFEKLYDSLTEYVKSRQIPNYWVAMSIQGNEESLWQFSSSSPRMFQSHNSSCSFFLTNNGCAVYSVGQLKYS